MRSLSSELDLGPGIAKNKILALRKPHLGRKKESKTKIVFFKTLSLLQGNLDEKDIKVHEML